MVKITLLGLRLFSPLYLNQSAYPLQLYECLPSISEVQGVQFFHASPEKAIHSVLGSLADYSKRRYVADEFIRVLGLCRTE